MTELTPKGTVKTVVKALCGVVMAAALLGPLLDVDAESYALNMAKYRENARELTQQGEEISDRLSRTIIEQECRTYILDKAAILGLELSDASVRLEWSSEGCWYPVGCSLRGEYSAELEEYISAELGIAPGEQEWVDDENS